MFCTGQILTTQKSQKASQQLCCSRQCTKKASRAATGAMIPAEDEDPDDHRSPDADYYAGLMSRVDSATADGKGQRAVRGGDDGDRTRNGRNARGRRQTNAVPICTSHSHHEVYALRERRAGLLRRRGMCAIASEERPRCSSVRHHPFHCFSLSHTLLPSSARTQRDGCRGTSREEANTGRWRTATTTTTPTTTG